MWSGCRLGSYEWRMGLTETEPVWGRGEDLGKDFPLSTYGLYAQLSTCSLYTPESL